MYKRQPNSAVCNFSDAIEVRKKTDVHTDRLAGKKYDCVILSRTDSTIGCYTHCDPPTEKTDADALSERDADVPFIAILPHTSKQSNLPHTDQIRPAGIVANINPNHHNCTRPALKQALLIAENI